VDGAAALPDTLPNGLRELDLSLSSSAFPKRTQSFIKYLIFHPGHSTNPAAAQIMADL